MGIINKPQKITLKVYFPANMTHFCALIVTDSIHNFQLQFESD